ncbi:hypothetical protein GDO81_002772 [Engystomops pustulosus]|uniref:DUF4524 domain-containing protein n=1 Tax=Engystomops pustulosus TaxID=76066 RepID=A0AAV7DS74_ENGPU|nr:hypothetical protein GDO81_002772 [Engystomops pustulosus]
MAAAGPRALLLFSDDSVEAQYRDGARLRLSACGSEFMYERPQPGAHPARSKERARHRTEYATSSCREQVLQALNFRNTFSCRPFLPSSLVAPDKVVTLLAEISEVTWPAVEDGAGCVTRLEDGSVRVSSLDAHAHFYMNALQREITVKFLCQLSSAPCPAETPTHKQNAEVTAAGVIATRNQNRSKYSSSALQEESRSCLTKHSLQYTWLLQRFSVADCPQAFHYPMGLALQHHRDSQGDITQSVDTEDITTSSDEGRRVSALPRALPLTCTATHLHRLSFCKFSLEEDDALAVNPLSLKVVMSDGVLYRFIWTEPTGEIHRRWVCFYLGG